MNSKTPWMHTASQDPKVLTIQTLEQEEDVDVEMSTNMSVEIKFQLSNENLKDDDEMQGGEGAENDFNQLFNMVDYVDHVVVPAQGTARVVLVFLPSSDDRSGGQVMLSKSRTAPQHKLLHIPHPRGDIPKQRPQI